MQIFETIESLQSALSGAAANTLGFVPTMGNLHAGHLSLVSRARGEHDLVVVSIFVNPLQFGANEALDSYPRTLDADTAALIAAGCDFLFLPSAAERRRAWGRIGAGPKRVTECGCCLDKIS